MFLVEYLVGSRIGRLDGHKNFKIAEVVHFTMVYLWYNFSKDPSIVEYLVGSCIVHLDGSKNFKIAEVVHLTMVYLWYNFSEDPSVSSWITISKSDFYLFKKIFWISEPQN